MICGKCGKSANKLTYLRVEIKGLIKIIKRCDLCLNQNNAAPDFPAIRTNQTRDFESYRNTIEQETMNKVASPIYRNIAYKDSNIRRRFDDVDKRKAGKQGTFFIGSNSQRMSEFRKIKIKERAIKSLNTDEFNVVKDDGWKVVVESKE